MDGTGLRGLALIESGHLRDLKAAPTMAITNSGISKIQPLGMHREGEYWKLENSLTSSHTMILSSAHWA
jgi:hypothetical protein